MNSSHIPIYFYWACNTISLRPEGFCQGLNHQNRFSKCDSKIIHENMSSDYKLIGTNNYIPTGLCYHSKSGKTIEGTKQGILASKKDLTDMEKEINEFDDINNIIQYL